MFNIFEKGENSEIEIRIQKQRAGGEMRSTGGVGLTLNSGCSHLRGIY